MFDKQYFDSYISEKALYFVKYGKGGVLICLADKEALGIADEFNQKNDVGSFLGKHLYEVSSVEQVTKGYFSITIQISTSHSLTRHIYKNEVTVEVYSKA
jgi:hypothetical protein